MTPDPASFDFELPEELIAQRPLADRAGARMLVVDRAAGTFRDSAFHEFPSLLKPGDCLVLNDTRVFPARLFGHRAGHTGQVEVFLVRTRNADRREWLALVRPGKRVQPGCRVEFSETLWADVVSREPGGERVVRFNLAGDALDAALDSVGHVPLPPYIRRKDEAADRERYQTVFARERGSAAAPTAGLHFTPEVLEQCRARGADVARVTLHVGLGTFQPLSEEALRTGLLHEESFTVTEAEAARLRVAQRRFAVGTTSARTLETLMLRNGLQRDAGETRLFIHPGFAFQAVGALLTNFHLPQSSLLMLVAALAGKDLVMEAYRHAVKNGYRLFSYGDAMAII